MKSSFPAEQAAFGNSQKLPHNYSYLLYPTKEFEMWVVRLTFPSWPWLKDQKVVSTWMQSDTFPDRMKGIPLS